MAARSGHPTSDGVHVSSAWSQDQDPARAAEELALALGRDAALYVVFVTVPYDLDGLAAKLTELWGERVVGCTSTRFFGPTCQVDKGVMAVALTGDLSVSTIPIVPLDHLTRGVFSAEPRLRRAREAARDAAQEGRDTVAFLLVDGLSLQEEQLVDALTTGLGGIPLVGGSASDDLTFERTLVLADGRFTDNAATCTLLTTGAPVTTFQFQHYRHRDETLVITSATPERRLVHEINGVPAATAYAEAIGVTREELTNDIMGAHPLVLRAGDESWVRAVAQVCEGGTLRFFAAIDTGAVLRLGEPTDPIDVMREGFRAVRERVGDLRGVLALDCILRHAEFQRTGVDPEIARELSRHGVHGFSTYGEQYDGMHVNQTMVGIAFGSAVSSSPHDGPAATVERPSAPGALPPARPDVAPDGPGGREEPGAQPTANCAELARLERINQALIDATERRMDGGDASSSFGRWEQTLTLHRLVEERTEQARATELLLRSVIDSIDGRMCIVAGDGTVLGTNRLWDEAFPEAVRMARERGTRPGQVGFAVGSNLFEVLRGIPGRTADLMTAAVREVLENEVPFQEVRGEWRRPELNEMFTLRVHRVRDHAEAKALLIMVDITDALRTQEKLRQVTGEARLLDRVVRQMDNSVFILSPTGGIEWVNDAFCRSTGLDREEVIGLDMPGLLVRLRMEMDFERVLDAQRTGCTEVEVRGRSCDGRVIWMECQIQRFDEDETQHLILLVRNVTSRRQAEEQLAAAHRQTEQLAGELMREKALLDHVLASIPQIVYWKDLDLRYAGVNDSFTRVRGCRDVDVLGRTEGDLVISDAFSEVLPPLERQVLATGEAALDVRVVVPCDSGPARQYFVSVLPQRDPERGIRGVIGVAADITELSDLERQVAQSTRLEAIGQLAAGIAHEINTPVQFVSDNTRFIAECFEKIVPALHRLGDLVPVTGVGDPGSGHAELAGLVRDLDLEFITEEAPVALAQSLEGLDRVANIVRAMKDFSHPGRERTETDLNRAVESTVNVSRNEWKYVAQCHVDLDPGVGSVPCFEGEIKQAVLNLVVNAAQAIGEHRERTGRSQLGTIEVSTRRVGDSVVIEVGDDGPGMTEDVKARIFDPFFTTKEIGKGTGQGLSLVHATVVQKHQGTIDVETAPGCVSRFVITIPAPAGTD